MRTMIHVAALLAFAATLHAQSPRRLPVISGSMGFDVLVAPDGTMMMWGEGGGDGPPYPDGTRPTKTPIPIPGLHDIVDAAVGRQHVLVLQSNGTVLGWGLNNGCELGVKDDRTRKNPIEIAGVRDAIAVAAGDAFSGALLKDGTLLVWGASTGLATKDHECIVAPTPVPGLSGVKKFVIGGLGAIALKQDGTVWAWGGNDAGQLCDGTTTRRDHPVQMHGIANAIDVALDGGNSLVALADGTVRMCGTTSESSMATLPRGPNHTTPVAIPGLTGVVAVQMDGDPIVRLRDGTLLGWGRGVHGALGDGFVDKEIAKPHSPIGLGPVLAHWFASNEGYALKADGTVMRWGFFVGGDKEWALKPVPFYKIKLE